MGIPDWIWDGFSEFPDEELTTKVLSGEPLGGYVTWILQERQRLERTWRRRKMLARLNRFWVRRRRETEFRQMGFNW